MWENKNIEVSYKMSKDTYKVPCSNCGDSVYVWKVRKDVSYKCKFCKEAEKFKKAEKRKPLSELESERRLEIAKEYLQRKGILNQYQKPIEVLNKHLYKTGWFQSSNEVLVGLELLRNGYKFNHQVIIGRWRADFIIPDIKIVLEVDGEMFHNKNTKEKEQLRDNFIINKMGEGWEVIRIKDSMLRKNIQRLIPAIKKVITERQKIRNSYTSLPNWYSDTHS